MKKKQKKVIVAKKDKDHPSATRHLTSGNKSFRDKSDSYSFSATSSKKSTPNTSNLSSFVEKSDGDFSKLMSSNYHEKMKNVRERDLISTMNLSMRPKTTAQLFPNQNPLLSKTLSSTVKTSNPSIPRVCFTNIQRIQNNKTQLVKKSSGRDTPENLKKRFANTGDLNKIKLIYKQIATSSSLDTTNENNAFMFNQEGTIPIYNSAGNLNQNMNTLNDSDLTDESYFDSENPGNRKTRKVKKSLFYYHHEKDENGLISMKKYRKSDYTSASCSDSENPGQRKKKFIKKSNCIYATIPNPSNPKEKITKKFNRDEYTSESCSNPENPNKRNKKYVKKSEFLYETVFVPDPDNPSHTHKIIQKTKLNDPKFVFEEYSDPNNPGKKKLRKLNKEEFTSEEYSDPDHPNQMKKRFVKKDKFFYETINDPNDPTKKKVIKTKLNDPKFVFEEYSDPENPGEKKLRKMNREDFTSEEYSDPDHPNQMKKRFVKKDKFFYETINDPNDPTKKKVIKTKLNDPKFVFEEYSDPENPGEKKLRKMNREDFTSEEYSDPDHPNQMKKRFVKKDKFFYETINDPNDPTKKKVIKTKLDDPKFVFEEYSDPENPGKKKLRKLNKEEFTSEEYSDPDHPNQMKKRFVKKDKFFYETINDPNDPTKKKVIKTKLNDPKFVFEEYSDPENPGEKKLRKMNREDFTSEEYSDPDHPNQMKKRFVKKDKFFYETINDPNDPTKKKVIKTKLDDPKFVFEEYSDPENPGEKKLRKLNKEEFTSEEYSDPDHPNQMKKRFVKKNEFYYRKVSHPNNPTQKIIQKVRLNDPKFFFETVPDPKNPGKTKVLCFEIGIDCELESYSDPENPGQRKQQIKKLLNPKFQKYQKFTKINKETNTNTKKAKDFSIEKDKDQVDLNIQPPPLPLRLLPLCDAFAQTSPKPKHIFIKTTVDIPKRPETPKANPPHIRFENDGMIDTFHAVYTKIMPHTTCEIPPDPNFPPTRRGYKNNLSIPNNFSTPSSMRNITRTTIANVESRITKKPAMTFGATPGTISISKSPYSQNTMKTRNGIEFDSPDFDFDSFENQPSFLSFAGLTKFEHMNRVIKNMATHANEKSKQQPSRSQQNPHNVSPRRRTPKP